MRHAHAHADAGVALLFAQFDLLNHVGADLDVRVGVQNAGEELQGALLARVGQFEKPAFL